MSQTRLLHLDYSPALSARWINRVQSTLQACASPILGERHSRWDKDRDARGLTLGDLAIAVGTKLTMVPLIVRRVDARLQAIGSILQSNRSEVEACLQSCAAYHLADSVVYEAVIDFDSFFFESTSAYEITILFLERFFGVILAKPLGTASRKAWQQVEQALRSRGAQTDWVGEIYGKRNLLIHERALWLALEVTDGNPFRLDPLLLTKNVTIREDDPHCLGIEQCRNMWYGFVSSYEHIETWLKEEIARVDAGAR